MTREEQETVIRFDATRGAVEIWTANPAVARRMEKAKQKPYRVTSIDVEEAGWFYRVPFEAFRWRVGPKRKASPAAIAALAASRLRKAPGSQDLVAAQRGSRTNSTEPTSTPADD